MVDVEKYRKYRNEFNKLKHMAQKDYYACEVEEFRHKTKDLWKVINNIIGKNKHRGMIISHIAINGVKTYSPKVMANEFAQFYSTLGANLAAQINPGHTPLNNYMTHIKRVDASLILKPVLQSEVEDIVLKLLNKTSYGHDRISNILLKRLVTCISFPLCSIFNQSIAEGKFPSEMKYAEVIPSYKGKEFDKVVNYRPVSLLITISKVLEKAIYLRVYQFLEQHKVLYNSQYGFRSKRSCEQAILELTGRILDGKNKGMHSAAMFLDLSKAFNTLDHSILLKKLDLYGLRGVCNDWFRDYLSDRKLVCRLTTNNGVTKSGTFDITYGTAQGSCLGPLLFILFCNDIQLLPTYLKIILFADDTILLYSHKNLKFLKYALEHDMVLLSD